MINQGSLVFDVQIFDARSEFEEGVKINYLQKVIAANNM